MGVGRLVQFGSILAALIIGLIGGFEYSNVVIAILGIAGGMFIVKEDRAPFLLATVTLILAGDAGSLAALPTVGEYIHNAIGELASLFCAGAMIVILVGIWERVRPTG
ncbi:MAG: hypothetical protein QNI99_08650 [Woeseiaceae bacterium]|nr:hypothetical protein [Woeseiaceae bacterium]